MGESAYNVTINNYDETGEAAGQTANAMRPVDNKSDVFYIVIFFFGNSIFYIIMSNNSIDLLALGI